MNEERSESLRPFRVGITAAWLHADAERALYNGRPLLYVEQSMAEWLMKPVGIWPVLIPAARDGLSVAADPGFFLRHLDGLVVQGGADVAPPSYGESALKPEWSGDAARDANEIALIKAALALNRPILGICRGHQILNVALGGTLYQDLGTQIPGARTHRDARRYHHNIHEVSLKPESGLFRLYGTSRGKINSVHHQGIKDLGEGLVVEAYSPEDGVIEAVRLVREGRYAVGLQWHPEFQEPTQTELLSTTPILDEFIGAMRRRRQSRNEVCDE